LHGLKVRSAHLGYDCYVCGPLDGQRTIRCVFKRHRAPSHMSAELIDMLPPEFRWPTAGFNEAHAAIEALYTVDVRILRSYLKQFPDHHFGFESTIDRFERWHTAAKQTGAGDVEEARQQARDRVPVAQARERPISPLLGWVKHQHPLQVLPLDQVDLHMSLIYFSDGMPALRLDAYPTGMEPGSGARLTRIHADLLDDVHEVIEHYPGRYLTFGLDPIHLRRILGVTVGRQRRTAMDNPHAVAARENARQQASQTLHGRAYQTLRESRAMQVAADPSGDPEQVFGAHLLPAGAAR
jgi:hypothetical protein